MMKKNDDENTEDKQNNDIELRVKELEDKIGELNNKYLRSLADYQNLEKQTQAWREDFVKFANQGLILELLDILDNLEKAQEHLKDEGLGMVLAKFRNVLKNNGLTEVSAEGEDFNPAHMEAVEVIAGDDDNKVVGVHSRGYELNGRIIRPAKVRVSQKQS